MVVDLLFRDARASNADLVFGASDVSPGGANVSIVATLPSLLAVMNGAYDSNTIRGPSIAARSMWADGDSPSRSVRCVLRDAAREATSITAEHTRAIGVCTTTSSALRTMGYSQSVAASRWSACGRNDTHASIRWALHRIAQQLTAAAWASGPGAGHVARQRWQERYRAPRIVQSSSWGGSVGVSRRKVSTTQQGAMQQVHFVGRWQEAWPPRAGVRPVTPITPNKPCYTPPPGDAVALLFDTQADRLPDLLFRCTDTPPAVVVVPVRRTYLVINDASLVRVSDGIALPCESMSVGIDADSWTWSFSASLVGVDLDAVFDPASPVAVAASFNGHEYRAVIERVQIKREFGKRSISVSGRGVAAELDSPYASVSARANVEAVTAQQLMADALTENGVSLGWSLDWRITDWLVPAGAWSHQGTPIAAVLAIADAAGAIVQADPASRILTIAARYPVAPWDWATTAAAISIPLAIIDVESVEPTIKPVYNQVYVSGEAQGVIARCRRAGTAGDLSAPMITHALITHDDAARQRALPILADVGAQALVSLSLPITGDTDVIEVGALAEVADPAAAWRGLVRSSKLTASWSNGLKVRQAIEVERHL